jgi:hypothetical protein
MKEYYYLTGKDQNGPFTIEQLADKGLTNETLIWSEGMENWQKLKDIPELTQTIKPKSVPPPPPSDTNEKISKTEVSGQLKVTTEKTPNPALEAIKPSRQTLTWLIVWCGFHLFALLMSYSQIEIFNDSGKPKSDAFWPFVKFQYCTDEIVWDTHSDSYGIIEGHKVGEACYFKGLFVDYDWTEFAFYVGGAILIYLLVRISKKQEVSNPQ